MLDARQLSNIQTMWAKSLDLTASTTRNTAAAGTVDQYGNPTETWTAVLTGVACGMAEPATSDFTLYPEAFIGNERRAKFSFATGSDVKANDRIATGGLTYRVQVRTDRDSYSALVQCIAVQINAGVN